MHVNHPVPITSQNRSVYPAGELPKLFLPCFFLGTEPTFQFVVHPKRKKMHHLKKWAFVAKGT